MEGEILIAEDDRDLRPLLAQTFETEGFDVTTFEDGAGLLQHLEGDGQPACILLDLMMPRVSGLAVLDEHSDGVLASTPVIVMSGRDDSEAVETALEGGADDYVTKPFGPMELVEQVRQYLD
jgi:two-component system alkaline phosphatase synthesis response regulator PhoP